MCWLRILPGLVTRQMKNRSLFWLHITRGQREKIWDWVRVPELPPIETHFCVCSLIVVVVHCSYFELLTDKLWIEIPIHHPLSIFTLSRHKNKTRLLSLSSTKLFLAGHCLVFVIKINTASSRKVHGDLSRHADLDMTLAQKWGLFFSHTIFRIIVFNFILTFLPTTCFIHNI